MNEGGDYVRLRDVPRLLGIGRTTLHDWIKAGKIKRYELCGMGFVKREDLQPRLIEQQTNVPTNVLPPDCTEQSRTVPNRRGRKKPRKA